MTPDQLRQLEQTTRERCQATAERARLERGLWDPVLRRWVEWDNDGPVTRKGEDDGN